MIPGVPLEITNLCYRNTLSLQVKKDAVSKVDSTAGARGFRSDQILILMEMWSQTCSGQDAKTKIAQQVPSKLMRADFSSIIY